MPQLFVNNAASKLATGINDTDNTIVLLDGSSFPSPSGGDFFNLTLAGVDGNGLENAWEIVKVTAIAADTMTVVRAQEGTAAVAWGSGTRVEARITADTLQNPKVSTMEVAGKTLVMGGNVTFSGAYTTSFTLTGNTGVTFPTSGTLLSTATAVTLAQGGTGASTAAGARTSLELNNVTNVAQLPLSYLDTDGTLAGNSDVKVPSQKAVKTYADALIAANDAMVFKGIVDCSTNPNYPAADRGHTYRVSVAGKIGGASGTNVEIGDLLVCLTDATAGGTQAAVGAAWNVVQANIDGAVIGPASATDGHVVLFDGVTGKLIKSSGLTLSGSNTGDETVARIGTLIAGATDKATPVDADYLGLMDSAAGNVLKKLSWANIKATLKAYFDTLYMALVAPGASGNVLTSNGSAWVSSVPTSSGAMTLLSTVTASNSATVDVETTFDSTYDAYMIVISGFIPASDGSYLLVRSKLSGAYVTTATYGWRHEYTSTSASANSVEAQVGTAETSIRMLHDTGNAAGESASCVMHIRNPASTSLMKHFSWFGSGIRSNGAVQNHIGAGFNSGTGALTGIRFFASGGNITSGTFRLYGIKNS